jgi:hypothetical protein
MGRHVPIVPPLRFVQMLILELKAKEHNFHVSEMLEIPKCPKPDPRHDSSSIGNVLSVLYPTASEENRVQDEMPAVPT